MWGTKRADVGTKLVRGDVVLKATSGRVRTLQLSMLTWVIICAVCALIFGLLGFSGIAAGFAKIARFLLAVFLILLVLALIFGSSMFHAAVR